MVAAIAQGMSDMAKEDDRLEVAVKPPSANSTPTSFRHWYEETLDPLTPRWDTTGPGTPTSAS